MLFGVLAQVVTVQTHFLQEGMQVFATFTAECYGAYSLGRWRRCSFGCCLGCCLRARFCGMDGGSGGAVCGALRAVLLAVLARDHRPIFRIGGCISALGSFY